MAFTRFHDDPARIKKSLEESAAPLDYYMNVPGPGVDLPFQNDVNVRMQLWGANMYTDTVNLESNLRGMDRLVNRRDAQQYKNLEQAKPQSFPSAQPFVEESRTTHPAYLYKDLPHDNWSYPQLNPQNLATIERPFASEVQTRILARDYYTGSVDDLETAKPRMPAFDPRNIFPLAGAGQV